MNMREFLAGMLQEQQEEDSIAAITVEVEDEFEEADDDESAADLEIALQNAMELLRGCKAMLNVYHHFLRIRSLELNGDWQLRSENLRRDVSQYISLMTEEPGVTPPAPPAATPASSITMSPAGRTSVDANQHSTFETWDCFHGRHHDCESEKCKCHCHTEIN